MPSIQILRFFAQIFLCSGGLVLRAKLYCCTNLQLYCCGNLHLCASVFLRGSVFLCRSFFLCASLFVRGSVFFCCCFFSCTSLFLNCCILFGASFTFGNGLRCELCLRLSSSTRLLLRFLRVIYHALPVIICRAGFFKSACSIDTSMAYAHLHLVENVKIPSTFYPLTALSMRIASHSSWWAFTSAENRSSPSAYVLCSFGFVAPQVLLIFDSPHTDGLKQPPLIQTPTHIREPIRVHWGGILTSKILHNMSILHFSSWATPNIPPMVM